jgi:hypothetical protein
MILYELKKRPFLYVEKADFVEGAGGFKPRKEVNSDFPLSQLAFPKNFRNYMDHLYHLGLAWITQYGPQDRLFDQTANDPCHNKEPYQLNGVWRPIGESLHS